MYKIYNSFRYKCLPISHLFRGPVINPNQWITLLMGLIVLLASAVHSEDEGH